MAPSDVAEFREKQCYEAFLNGDAVFMRGWPFMYALAVRRQVPGESGPDRHRAASGRIPKASRVGVASAWMEHAHQRFLQQAGCRLGVYKVYDRAPKQQKFRAREGSFLPTLASLYDDQEVLKQCAPVIEQSRDIVINNTRSRPVTPYYSVISSRLAGGFHASLTGETDPEQVVQDLTDEMQNIIQERSIKLKNKVTVTDLEHTERAGAS